ncbi:UvrD-helicase domain-containing protein [Micromonospora arborensis]|uniref:UvrD-helicase domain-containing protein n=1 Tax=Micromonospora arborensis TaxID=2116518 RepID=UPI0033CDB385
MKPLLTTVRALKELATGLSPEAISATPVLVHFDRGSVEVLVAADDKFEEQRIFIIRDQHSTDRFVPEHLANLRREVLSRIASFAERSRASGPLILPRGWGQYKHNRLISFFAVAGMRSDDQASRWIAEVMPGENPDIFFWANTTSDNKAILEEFELSKPVMPRGWEADWKEAIAAAAARMSQTQRAQPTAADVEILLSPLEQSATRGWSYEQWLDAITDDQRSFIEAETSKSIRLRGPAGSGKTLALTLKATREVLQAREMGDNLRVLIVTHSWSLASEISDSLDSMRFERLNEIDVFPLLEIAKNTSPQYVDDQSGFVLAGDDSFSGKQAQLDEINDVLDDFISGDWITYRARVTDNLRSRFESEDPDVRSALAWDLLVEFGSVIGAAAIFPGAGAEPRYYQLSRAAWMMPLEIRDDMRVVFAVYTKYMESLDARAMLTSDQVLADLLSHLETHAWNRARRTQGYDLIFVDEFHLFSPLERQVLHYLSRDVSHYPRVFMAVDPRQSPSEAFIGVAADETWSSSAVPEDGIGDITNFELTTVHRFTPQILELIKHVHHEFPTLDLGKDWHVDLSEVESVQDPGPVPLLSVAASRPGEENDIVKAVHQLYPTARLALAIVDSRQWGRYSDLASRIGNSAKFHVSTISGRSDIDGIGYRRRGLVVGPAEYLAGLQFDAVLVAGIPDMQMTRLTSNERTRILSLLYLALSRAQREVRVFVNEDDGGVTDVLARAVSNGVMLMERGSLV